ncbi:MAG: hypothetical protein WD341_13630 [Tistlia sp.]|uniref:hypothetical protein n=1 Tax=Tistlia sp. TaxID=3057121 RepID=UPI0034A3B012
MDPRRFPLLAAPAALLLAALLAPAPAAGQDRAPKPSPEARQETHDCAGLAAPAVEKSRAEVERRKPAEVQARLPELLARFAAQPELESALGCLMRRQPRG